MAALDYITIKGFKSIAQVEQLQLQPINVIIGPNGAGKSNFIGAFAFLHSIRSGTLQEYVQREGGADQVLHFGAKRTPSTSFEVKFRGPNKYSIRLSHSVNDQLRPTSEIASFFGDRNGIWNDVSLPSEQGEAGISRPNQQKPIAKFVREKLASWRVYHFHDTSFNSPMKQSAEVNDNRFLRADGANLAAYLYFLQQKHENEYSLIRRTVQQVAPFFDDFVLEPLKLNEDLIRLEWRHKRSDSYFNANSLSDGTLRFIALSVLLLQPHALRPSVILIDEPELGLHPYAITLLAALVRQSSNKTQVIVSTQSSLLLDNFEPEEVLVAERVDSGTSIARLDAKPLEKWLEEYSLGQLWEKNEIGGRPASE